MKMIRKAIKFGAEKHKGQERKISNLPYIIHPIEVSFIVSRYKTSKKSEELICAAILHDTLEDTNTNFIEIAKEFSPLVANLVLELTSDTEEIKLIGKNEYMKKKMVGMSNYGLFLKLADRYANISDSPTEKYKKDTRELLKHISDNRMLTKSQYAIVLDIYKELS